MITSHPMYEVIFYLIVIGLIISICLIYKFIPVIRFGIQDEYEKNEYNKLSELIKKNSKTFKN